MKNLRDEFEQQLQGLHLELSKQSDKMYFILYAEWLEDKIRSLDFETEEKAYSWLPVINKMTGIHLSVESD